MAKLKPTRITRIERLEDKIDYSGLSIDEVRQLKEIEITKLTFEQARVLFDSDGVFSKLSLNDEQVRGIICGDLSVLTDVQLEQMASDEFWE